MTSIEPKEFLTYLHRNLDEETQRFVDLLKSEMDVLIFSGVIRDFALNYRGPMRDLDLVVKRNFDQLEKIFSSFKNLTYSRNSFGGYKLTLGNMNIDIWDIANTWAFKEKKIPQTFFNEMDLAGTCFFNFSSVVFDLKSEVFIETKSFSKFRKSKMLDIVLKDNPYPELCIINSFYYREKFGLRFSSKLKHYLLDNFNKIEKNRFSTIQLKHFNRILFTYARLTEKIAAIQPRERS